MESKYNRKFSLKINGKEYNNLAMREFFLAEGSERVCFLNPENKNAVIKLSFNSRFKQTKREIKYFSFLKKRKIPFIHIPNYYGFIKGTNCLAIIQQLIKNYNGTQPERFIDFAKRSPENAKNLLKEAFLYLYRYNIIPCDLTCNNMLIAEIKPKTYRFFFIDGLHPTDFIPIAKYCPALGRLKMKRKFAALLTEELPVLFKNIKTAERWIQETLSAYQRDK